MTYFLSNWRFWVGLIVSVVALALLVVSVDRGQLWLALQSANYLYLIPAVAVYFVGQWLRAWRWQYLLAPVAQISVNRLFAVVNIGYMANNLLPARLGELVRAVYLAQREKEVSAPAALATLSVERLYDGLTLLAIGAVTTPILLAAGRLFAGEGAAYRATAILLAVGVMAGFVAALAVFTTLAVNQRAVDRLLAITRLLPLRFRPLATTLILGFVEGLATLNSPRKHATLFLRSFPVWLAEAGVYLIIAYSFNLDAYFASAGMLTIGILLVMVTSNLITAIPATVGGIGTFEAVATVTLIGMGIVDETAIAYSVAIHLLALWLPVSIVGLALLLWHNVSLRGLTALPDAEAAAGTGGAAAAKIAPAPGVRAGQDD